MPKFPTEETKIIELAQKVASGIASNATTFPNPPVEPTVINADLDAYFAKNNEIQLSKANTMHLTQEKNEILDRISRAAGNDIDYGVLVAQGDDAILQEIGWGIRAAPVALQPPGQCRAFEIVGQARRVTLGFAHRKNCGRKTAPETDDDVKLQIMKIKQTIFLFIIFAACVAATQAQTVSPPNSLDIESLVGKVKQIDEDTAEMRLKNGKLVEGWRSHSRTIAFDKKGRMTYRWWKIGESQPTETKFSYEKDGRIIQRTLYTNLLADSKKGPSERIGQSIFRYVASENALYRDVYPGEQGYANEPPRFLAQSQKYKYIFGDDNRLLETVDYFINTGDEATHDKNIYGDERLPIQRVLITEGSPFKESIKYTYTLDGQGNWTKRVSEDTRGDKNETVVYQVEYRKIAYYK